MPAVAPRIPARRRWRLPGGVPVTIRPIGAGDKALELAFLKGLSRDSLYQRLLSVRGLLPGELERLTNIDYEREMALIATLCRDDGEQQIGVARYVKDGDGAEFALVIADMYQRRGVGSRLLAGLVDHARSVGVRRLWGIALATNHRIREFARKHGFDLAADPHDATVTRIAMNL
jgi:acetyltransferase